MAGDKGLTMRQAIEGMTMFFDPESAGERAAFIQFNVTGSEPGNYYIRICGEECDFQLGEVSEPTLTIDTTSDAWMRIVNGEISGAEALTEGMYEAKGDLGLLASLDEIFKTEDEERLKAPAGQRPPGPLHIPGMAWLYFILAPWIFFWITFSIESLSRWVSVGVPFFVLLVTFVYRLAFYRVTWMEGWSLAFFTLAAIATISEYAAFEDWGVGIGMAAFALVWLSTIFLDEPLTAEFSRWSMNRRMWGTTLFKHPNYVLTLMWGWLFVFMGLLLTLANLWESSRVPLTIVSYALLVPAMVITFRYPKGADKRPFHWEKSLLGMRVGAAAGLVCASALLVVLLSGILTPA